MEEKYKNLHEHLQQLHGELERTETADEKARALLHEVKADIGGLLERSQAGSVQPEPPVLERLEQAVDAFETSHPNLTRLLAQALETLSNAGV